MFLLSANKRSLGKARSNETVTKHKQTEEALGRSESRNREPLGSLTNMFASLDIIYFVMELTYDENGKPVDGIFREVNSATERLLGKSKEQLIGKSRKELFGNVFDELPEKFETVFKTGKPAHFEGYGSALQKYYDICAWKTDENQVGVILRDISEQKKAASAILEQKARAERYLNVVGNLILALDTHGNITLLNKRGYEILGYQEGELEGKSWAVCLPKENRKELGNIFQTWVQGKTPAPMQYESPIITKNGDRRLISWYNTELKDEKGRLVGTLSSGEDITEQRKAEKSLMQSEERFSKAFSANPAAISISRLADGLLVDVNETYLRFFEFTRQEVIGHTSAELNIFTSPDERKKLANILEKKGQVRNVDISFKTKTGKIFDAIISIDQTKAVDQIYVISTIVDITERKRTEEKLAEYRENLEKLVKERTKKLALSNQKLSEILESIQEGFYVLDRNWNFVYANKQITSAVGMEPKDWVGRNLWKMFPSYTGKPIEKEFREAMEKREIRRFESSSEYSGICYWVTVFPSFEGISVLGTNVTERKKLEKQLQDKERLATIGATAGMVGHDIRNPLQAIVGDLFIAKKELAEIKGGKQKDAALECIDEIEKNVDYINKIVQDLQDYARPLNPEDEKTDFKLIIDKLLTKKDVPANIEVNVKIHADTEKIYADSYYINRILYNLVTNSVQAMPNGGKLTIQTYKEPNYVVISVKDTGVGIPKELQEKIFTPMFTTKAKGQGFGLPVVKRMTEALGGTVTFESQEGKGTTFIIRLPPLKIAKK